MKAINKRGRAILFIAQATIVLIIAQIAITVLAVGSDTASLTPAQLVDNLLLSLSVGFGLMLVAIVATRGK
jgi:dolichol kinase